MGVADDMYAGMTDPAPGFLAVGYTDYRGTHLQFRHRDATGLVRTSTFPTVQDMSLAAPLQTTAVTEGGVSLVKDASNRILRHLAAGRNMAIAQEADRLVLTALDAPLLTADANGAGASDDDADTAR